MDTLQFSAAATKTVTIEIAMADLARLKQSAYRLCVAKEVNGVHNVVWQSSSQYLATNRFQWAPQFQIFCTNAFVDGMQVRVATNIVKIGLGETSTLDEDGRLGPARTGGASTAISLLNQFGPIHPGLSQICTWIDDSRMSTPIFVAPQQVVGGTTVLTPVENVLVWFEQNIQTGTMFSTSRSKAVEIDLTVANTAKYLFQNQVWTRA